MQQVAMVTNFEHSDLQFQHSNQISQNLQSQFKYHIPFSHFTFYKSDFFCNLFGTHLIEIASQIFDI